VVSFINKTDDLIRVIKRNPLLYIESKGNKNIHKAYLTKHNSLFYKVDSNNNEIIILTIWDNRKDPKKLLY